MTDTLTEILGGNSALICGARGSVDLKTAAATTLNTTRQGSGIQFMPMYILVRMDTASALATIAASISVGTNSTSFNNVLAISALTGVLNLGNYLLIPLTTALTAIAEGTAITAKVTTPLTSTGTGVATVAVLGMYL